MCLSYRQFDPTSRRMYRAGAIFLAASLLPALFESHGLIEGHKNLILGLRFALSIVAIGLFCASRLRAENCAHRP